MDAEGAALAHDAVEKQRGGLGDGIVIDEELLELINQKQGAGHGLLAPGALVAGNVLHSQLAEDVAAALEFVVHPLKHAEAEFAVALNGDDAGMGQLLGGIALEFHALLEVNEVELDLVRAARQREVGDDDVEQGGLAGTGLACEQRMLARAFADGQVLQLGGTGAADGNAQLVGGVICPQFVRLGRDLGEGHFHAVGVDAALADFVDEADGKIGVGRGIEAKTGAGLRLHRAHDEALRFVADADAGFPQVFWNKAIWKRLALIPVNEGVNPALGTAGRNAHQALGGHVAEVRREVGDHQHVVLFGHAAGLFVVLGDALVLVAQVHLDHLFDVLVELGEALLNLVALGPDTAVDQALFIVRQVHETGEVLAQAHGVDDGEAQLAWRCVGQQAQDDVVERAYHGGFTGVLRLEQQRAFIREGEGQWQAEGWRSGQSKAGILGQRFSALAQVEIEVRKLGVGTELRGRHPGFAQLVGPFREADGGGGSHGCCPIVHRTSFRLPVLLKVAPLLLLLITQA